jgi:homocitrate synthase NifV
LTRIIDRTLSCLDDDNLTPNKQALSRFLALLTELNPGAIELSEAMYRLLSPLPRYTSYVLRLKRAADAEKYPDIAEFVCPEGASFSANANVRVEISRNNTIKAVIAAESAAERGRSRAGYKKLRVAGLAGALGGDYQQTFKMLKRRPIEFCPTNRFNCATALAAEWAMSGGGDGVVTAFGGLDGFAATEELIRILRIHKFIGADKNYGFLPEMARLFEKIAKKYVPPNKPVIGNRIFHVESGIHVDGILKQPMCYEPFPPEAVGQARKIVLGRQSGIASIRAKMSEFNLRYDEEDLPAILAGVKAKAAERRGAVTDGAFWNVIKSVYRNGINSIDGINTINTISDVSNIYNINGIDSITGLLRYARNDGHCEERSDEATCLSRREAIQDFDFKDQHVSTITNDINRVNAKPRRYIVDTTLRDGEQTPGVFFSANQKSEIAALLDSSGVYQIEAGVPAASPEEKAAIANIIKNRKKAVISVWARLVPSDIRHAIDVRPDLIHICVPVSQTQIREKLRTDKESVINKLRECLEIVEKSGIPLSVGFEDAFRADVDFMISVAQILLDSGVTRIRFSDTVGVASPSQCRKLLKKAAGKLNDGIKLGIHAHNDLGMAVANTIESAKSGCLYADVTVGGIGERAGNCGLADLVRASSSIFDWGMTAVEARKLQKEIEKINHFKTKPLRGFIDICGAKPRIFSQSQNQSQRQKRR